MDDLRLEEAHKELEELQRQMTTYRRAYSEKYIKANGIAIECIERVTELEKENEKLKEEKVEADISYERFVRLNTPTSQEEALQKVYAYMLANHAIDITKTTYEATRLMAEAHEMEKNITLRVEKKYHERLEKLEKENSKLRKQPEIIHCGECKHFTGLNDDEFALCDRGFTGMYVDADGSGFCKWAERRNNAVN